MTGFIKQVSRANTQAKWGSTEGIYPGFYLCVKTDGVETKRWFGDSFEMAMRNFEKACNTWLTENNGWRYTVEKSLGIAVDGRIAWGNMDLADYFC